MAVALGVHIGQQNLEIGELRATWRRFDGARFDLISVWDHFYEAPPEGGTPRMFRPWSSEG